LSLMFLPFIKHPGMGRKNMINCLAAANPAAMVGIRKAHLARLVFRKKLGACRINLSTNGWFPGCQRTDQLQGIEPPTAEQIVAANDCDRESPAAIIFTTGSTGPPKGVLYRHRNFIEQSQQIRDYFSLQPGAVDVSGFPLFALFNTAMGSTTVFPAMDATKPAENNFRRLNRLVRPRYGIRFPTTALPIKSRYQKSKACSPLAHRRLRMY